MTSNRDMEFRWSGRILPPELTETKIIILSDLHYGNPYCSVKHFARTIKFIRDTENCYCFLNGDLCESSLRTSKGDIFTLVGTPQDQRGCCISYPLVAGIAVIGINHMSSGRISHTDTGELGLNPPKQ